MSISKARQLADLLDANGSWGAVAPHLVSDQSNTSTGFFDLPTGTTAERPSTPNLGYVRFNTTLGVTEQYTTDGWAGIAPPPTITSITPNSYSGELGTVITINGSGFDNNAIVRFITATGYEAAAGTTTRVSSGQLTATAPQAFAITDSPISIKVVNGSGLSTVLPDTLDVSNQAPIWNTASGQLASVLIGEAVSTSVSATDPEGGVVTYAKTIGDFPFTLDSSSGVITGTAGSTDATHAFTLAASDPTGNQTARPFSIRVIDPAVDTGGGAGWATAYSVDTVTDTITNSTMTAYNTPPTATPVTPTRLWDWAWEPSFSTDYFSAHSGHDGNQDYYAVQVSTDTPVVANTFEWLKHNWAPKDIVIYGSNQNITSSNFQQLDLWTQLGTGDMGGNNSGGEGTIKTATLNPNLYGYRWYMVRTLNDNGSTVTGWAMYSARFRRV